MDITPADRDDGNLRPRVLEGVRVIEMARFSPVAFTSMILADLGADVIKVEPTISSGISGSATSATKQARSEQNSSWINRNKRSLTVDYRTPDGQQVMRRLASNSDALIEGFRPGTLSKYGLGYEELKKENASLIMCSLTGYGQDGPYGKVAGHDLNYLALSGVLGLLGTADEVQLPLNLVADLAGGAMFATIAILAALHSRSHGGSGQYLDLSYVDGTLALLGATTVMRQHLTQGFEPGPGIGLHSGLYPYYTTYSCKDGKGIAVGCAETPTWQALCAALDEPELIPVGPSPHDHWRAPESAHHRARARLAEIFATRDRDEWIAQLSPVGTCVSKVSEVAELFSDPQLRHRSMVHDGMLDAASKPEHNIMSPLRMTGRGYLANVSAPYRGQQSDEILEGLGYTESEVRDLRSRNVV